MAARRRIKRTRKSNKVQASITSLPKELLTDVIARVASGSVNDLFNAELSCKDLLKLGNDDYVLQQASMEKFPLAPWPVNHQAFSFLKRCKESGNAEALFRQGMFEYFSLCEAESGFELLKKATHKGHVEATYVYGLLLLCYGDQKRQQGLKLLSSCLKNTKSRSFRVGECRRRVKRVLWSLWVRNAVDLQRRDSSLKRTCKCWNTQRRGWEEEDYGDTCSDTCFWNREITLFCNLIRPDYV